MTVQNTVNAMKIAKLIRWMFGNKQTNQGKDKETAEWVRQERLWDKELRDIINRRFR
jgi:hypothetical protein